MHSCDSLSFNYLKFLFQWSQNHSFNLQVRLIKKSKIVPDKHKLTYFESTNQIYISYVQTYLNILNQRKNKLISKNESLYVENISDNQNQQSVKILLENFINCIYHLLLGDFILINQKLTKKYLPSALAKLILIETLMQYTWAQSNCSVPNCTTCVTNSSTNCSACQAGFKVASYTCCSNTLTNCKTCRNDSSKCDICTSTSFFLLNNTCQLCNSSLSFCDLCSSSTSCLTCQSTYYTVNSTSLKCQPCITFMPLCLYCESPSACIQCVNNSFAVNTTSAKCQKCSQLLSDCTNCTSQTACIKCRVSPNIVFSAGLCKPCINVMPKCLNCTNANYCTLCANYFALKNYFGASLCYACSILMVGCLNCLNLTVCTKCSAGSIVEGGCSLIAGCTAVIQSPPIAICNSCNSPEFFSNPVNGICICSVGHLAGKYCTQIIGCTSIDRTSTGDQCTICDTSLHFYNINSTCICQQFFSLNGQQCLEICGDGKRFVLSCDDGNTVNGDGCSSKCKVEKGYHCISLSNQRSKCIFAIRMSMNLICIYNLGANKADVVFSISPSIDNFAKSNLTDLIAFNTSLNFTYVSYKIINLMLYVTIQYHQDIENGYAIAIIGYDQNYFTTTNSIIPFTFIDCNQYQLIYDPNPSEGSEEAVTAAIKAICALAWLAWAVGSFAHKMVGVETLHTIQLIFIMQAFALRYKPVVTYFKGLNSILNGYQSIFSSKNPVNINQAYLRLSFQADFISNTSVLTFLSFPCLMAYIYLFLRQRIEIANADSSLKLLQLKELQSIKKWIKYQHLLYRFFVFPLMMGFFINFVLSLMIQSNSEIEKTDQSRISSTLMSLYLTISVSILFFNEYFLKRIAVSTKSYKKGYTSIYLFIILVTSIIIHLFLSKIFQYRNVYFIAGTQILYSTIILLYRPYTHPLHTWCVFINQIGIFLNIAWIISQQYLRFNRSTEEIFANVLIGWIFTIIFASFVRSFYQIRTKKRPHKTKVTKRDKKRLVDIDQEQFFKNICKNNSTQINQYYLNLELLKKRGYLAEKNKNIQICLTKTKDVNRGSFKVADRQNRFMLKQAERQAL